MDGASVSISELSSLDSNVKERCLFRIYGLIGAGKTSLLRRTYEVLGGRAPISLAVKPGKVSERDGRYLEGIGIRTKRLAGDDLEDELPVLFWRTFRGGGAVFVEERTVEFPPRLRYEREIRIWIQPIMAVDMMPEKFPEFFDGVDLVILNQIDLLTFADFSVERFKRSLRSVRPGLEILGVSCRTGVGLEVWRDWFLYRMGIPPLEANPFG